MAIHQTIDSSGPSSDPIAGILITVVHSLAEVEM